MRPRQRLVSFTPSTGTLRRYFVDWLGNLKFMGEAQVIPPQQEDFKESVELFRLGAPVAIEYAGGYNGPMVA